MKRVNISEVIFSSVFHFHNSERSLGALALFALGVHRADLFCTVKQLRFFIKYNIVKQSLQDQCWAMKRLVATLRTAASGSTALCTWAQEAFSTHTCSKTQKHMLWGLWRLLWILDHRGLQAITINKFCSPGKTGLKCFLNGPLLIQRWAHSLSMI